MITLTPDTLLIVVPKESWDYELSNSKNEIRYWEMTLLGAYTGYQKLPPGSYTILFCKEELTEEKAKMVVGLWATNLPFYRNYQWPNPRDHYYDKALESFQSLLTSKSVAENSNWVLLQKKKVSYGVS
jgi:hypothetical protein